MSLLLKCCQKVCLFINSSLESGIVGSNIMFYLFFMGDVSHYVLGLVQAMLIDGLYEHVLGTLIYFILNIIIIYSKFDFVFKKTKTLNERVSNSTTQIHEQNEI